MTVATLPVQRVAQAPLSYRKNVSMLRRPQLAALRRAFSASMQNIGAVMLLLVLAAVGRSSWH
jgi:hypothetical protein